MIKEKYIKNSVVSVRSYLQKTIGESLNNALYELEIRRETIKKRMQALSQMAPKLSKLEAQLELIFDEDEDADLKKVTKHV